MNHFLHGLESGRPHSNTKSAESLRRWGTRSSVAAITNVGAPIDIASTDPERDPKLKGITELLAMHRLREVCLYGFTRFEPAPLADDGIEDVGLAVNGAPLGEPRLAPGH